MSNRTRLWMLITGVFCAVLIFFGIIGGFVPQLADASSTNDQTEMQASLNEMQRSRIDALDDQKSKTQQLETDLLALEAAIPPYIDSAGLLRDLETLQQSSGALVLGVGLGAPISVEADVAAAEVPDVDEDEQVADSAELATEASPGGNGIFEVPLSLNLTGTFDQVREFLRGLQLNERLVYANTVEMSGSGDLYTASVEAVIFALPA